MTELCQRATKAAIREAIAAEEERKKLMTGEDDQMMEMDDPVPVITRGHFEEALGNARRSVTEYDLNKFEQFRQKFDPAYASKVAGKQRAQINWPEDNTSQFQKPEEDDDDLYA